MRRFGFELGEGLARQEEKDRYRHLYCVGRSGSGKSTFLLNLIQQEFEHCCIVVDPAGSFAEAVASLAPRDRLIYVDKFNPLVINPLAREGLHWSEVASEFAEMMNACVTATTSSPDSTVLMGELIRNAVRVLVQKEKNIEYMAELLNDHHTREKYKHTVIDGQPNPKYDKYWGKFDELEAEHIRQFAHREKRDSARRVATRLSAFYDNETLRAFTIGKDGKNQFDVKKFVANRNIVVLNLSNFDNDAKIYLGILAISCVKSFYNHKGHIKGDPLYLYVDEFHSFGIPYWPEMITQSRKFNVSINIAHQDHEQVDRKALSSILGTVHTKVVFSCGHNEAVTMGNDFDLKPEELKNLGKYEAYIRIGNQNEKLMTDPPPDVPVFDTFNFMKDDSWIDPNEL